MSSAFRLPWGHRYPLRHRGERVTCNLCGSEDRVVVRTRDRYLNRLINVMCRHCGLVFLDPMPSDEDVGRYYRFHFWKSSQGGAEPTAKRLHRDAGSARRRRHLLADVLKPGMRILDVGAGSGAFLRLAKEEGYEVEGIEPNVGYARYAERTYGVTVHDAMLADVDFGDRRFDLVTCAHALEHMRDPLGALRRFHALLEPTGYLHIRVPDLGAPDKSPLAFLHSGHLFGFMHETLVMMAARAGFAPIDARGGTIMIFRRLPEPDPDWFRFPDHAAACEAMFRERTMGRYLLATDTFRRIPKRVGWWLQSFRGSRALSRSSRRSQ